MPRDSSGTYSLPNGNPVQTNTLIETAWANPTMADLKTALTDSLDRNGRGTMLSALKITDGAVAAPGLSFNSEASSGLYRAGSHDIRLSVGGVDQIKVTDTGVGFPGSAQIFFGLGTALLPSYSFTGDPNTGMWSPGADLIAFSTNGAEALRIVPAGILFSAGATGLLHNDTTTYMSFSASSSLVDGVARVNVYDSAHPTSARFVIVCGKQILFTDSAATNEKARFTAATAMTEFVLGRTTALYTLANRSALEIDGTVGGIVGLHYNGARCGYLYSASTTEFRISTGLATVAMTFCLNGTEVARVDTDSTFQYQGIEVGWRGMPVVSTSANPYNMVAANVKGKCVVQTTSGATINPNTGWVAGDVVSVCNKSGGNVTLSSTGITMNWGSTPATGARVLANNALVTLFFTGNNVATLTGTGIS